MKLIQNCKLRNELETLPTQNPEKIQSIDSDFVSRGSAQHTKLTVEEYRQYSLENYPYCLNCHTDYPDCCDCVENSEW